MKVSNRILVIVGLVIVAIILGIVISSRIFVTDAMDSSFPEDGVVIPFTLEGTTAEYEVKDFSAVTLSGAWEVEIRRDAGYKMTISMPVVLHLLL